MLMNMIRSQALIPVPLSSILGNAPLLNAGALGGLPQLAVNLNQSSVMSAAVQPAAQQVMLCPVQPSASSLQESATLPDIVPTTRPVSVTLPDLAPTVRPVSVTLPNKAPIAQPRTVTPTERPASVTPPTIVETVRPGVKKNKKRNLQVNRLCTTGSVNRGHSQLVHGSMCNAQQKAAVTATLISSTLS